MKQRTQLAACKTLGKQKAGGAARGAREALQTKWERNEFADRIPTTPTGNQLRPCAHHQPLRRLCARRKQLLRGTEASKDS